MLTNYLCEDYSMYLFSCFTKAQYREVVECVYRLFVKFADLQTKTIFM